MPKTAIETKTRSELVIGTPILIIASITAMLTGPGQTIGVSVFIDHFVSDLSLSRSQISTAYLIGTLAGSTAMPFVGRFVDRRGVRISQVVVGVLFGLSLLYMSTVNGLIMLSIGFIGIRMLGQGSLSMISTVTVQLRFVTQRGMAIGIFAMVTGGLMALMPIGLNWVIEAAGWRSAWRVAAIVIWLTVIPLGALGLRSMPRPLDAKNQPATSTPRLIGMTRGEAVRCRSFWVIAVMSTTASMLSTALNFHQIDLLGDAGLTSSEAASMFLPQVIGSIVAGLVIGTIADKIGTRYLPVVPMVLLVIVHLVGADLSRGAIVFAYAILLGSMGGATRSASATLMPDWFGTAHIGSIQGVMTLAVVAGSALGPISLSLAEEALGGYRPALLSLAVIPAMATIFAATAPRPPRPETG